METVKLNGIEALLQRVSDARHNGNEVPVNIIPEPENSMDKNALWIVYDTSWDIQCGIHRQTTRSNCKQPHSI